MTQEIWKPIVGYENYEVSNYGRVKSLNYMNTGKPHIIANTTSKWGYVKIHLCKEGKRATKLCHRLVAEAFIPNPENKPCIDHINGDRQNNCVENLRWCTSKENSNNPITLQRKSSSQVELAKEKWGKGCFNMRKKRVAQYTLDGVLVAYWESTMEAARNIGCNDRHIASCCRGERKTCGGYKWAYERNTENSL